MRANTLERKKATYKILPADAGLLKQRMLSWANRFSILLFLDSNSYASPYGGYECLLAAGAARVMDNAGDEPFGSLLQEHRERPDWMFGHICYDYKNTLEPGLRSHHEKRHGWQELQFFVPQTVCTISRDLSLLTIESFDEPGAVYNSIVEATLPDAAPLPTVQFTPFMEREQYLATVDKLRTHIKDGDCYEINFCSGGEARVDELDTLATFNRLNALSPAPFAAYYRQGNNYMMSASPERYIKKEGNKLICQPIKGTARRQADATQDETARTALQNDVKERAENVMIVDLVRNDLARSCEVGSVQVDELFGIYSFPQVHQMISTVSGRLRHDQTFADALRTTFPMGSMTGAPKYKVMQLTEAYEPVRRELFSGTVGYISPNGDMDLNVIIRSLFYNAADSYLSYSTGGAITYDSVPEKEWDEMRLKAWALERIFAG
ncbi:MAG: anthranilate synthase component I family protein [Taibaiella sp.]|nr:anthranilate synthase component I family protein [Taibaiella sp.]